MRRLFYPLLIIAMALCVSSCHDEDLRFDQDYVFTPTLGQGSQTLEEQVTPLSCIAFHGNIFLAYLRDTKSGGQNLYIKTLSHDYKNKIDGLPSLRNLCDASDTDLLISDFFGIGKFVTWEDHLYLAYTSYADAASNWGARAYLRFAEIGADPILGPKIIAQGNLNKNYFLAEVSIGNQSFSVTELNGSLYLAMEREDNHVISLYRSNQTTPTVDPTWTKISEPNIEPYVTPENFDAGVWDLTTATYEDPESKKLRTDLYICRQKTGNELEMYRLRDPGSPNPKWEWTNAFLKNNIGGATNISVVQGGLLFGKNESDKLSQNSKSYPLQLICANGNYVTSQLFYPETFTWGPQAQLDVRGGKIAACIAPVMPTGSADGNYMLRLYVFNGKKGRSLSVDHYPSNFIKVNSVAMIDKNFMLSDSVGRKMCNLVGIVEGPPPTMCTTENDFNYLSSSLDHTFSIKMVLNKMNESSCSFTSSTIGMENSNVGGSVGTNRGPGFTAAIKFGMSYDYEFGESETRTSSVAQEISISSSWVTQDKALLLYLVPNLMKCTYTLCAPRAVAGEPSDEVWSSPFTFNLYETSSTIVMKEMPLTEEPFMIENPRDLNSWVDRWLGNGGSTTSSVMCSMSYKVGGGVSQSATVSSTYSHSDEYKRSETVSVGCSLGMKLGLSTDFSSSTKISFSRKCSYQHKAGITMSYSGFSSSLPDSKVKRFDPHFVIVYSPNDPRVQHYYDNLTKRKLMLEDETPWVVGYGVTDLEMADD